MKKLTTILALALLASLLMVSCASGTNSDSTTATSVYATQLKDAISYSDPSESEESPKLLMIDGDRILNISDAKIRQAANVIMDGNTLVFLNASPLNLIAFGKRLNDVKEDAERNGDDYFVARFTLNTADSWTPSHFLEQVTDKILAASSNGKVSEANFDKKFYEAIGVRKNHTYFVYSLDADLLGLRFDPNVQFTEVGYDDTYDGSETIEKTETQNTDALIKHSIEDFSKWILEKNTNQDASTQELQELLRQADQAATPSALQQLKDAAKTFSYSFPVVISTKNTSNVSGFSNFVAGYFNERRENVTVEVTVWTVCDIDRQIDYYMIKNSATCHNEQLKFMDLWKSAQLTYGPFFKECKILTTIDPARQTVRSSECSPETTTGSTSHSSGFNISLGGSLGFSGAGTKGGVGGTGGFSGGLSFSDSTSTSIPDIQITRNTSNADGASWLFSGADFAPSEWIWVSDHRESVKDIQKKEATFTTYAIITVPSSSETTNEKIKLYTSVQVNAFKRFPRNMWETTIGHNCLIIKGEFTNNYTFIATVPKPNNAKGTYIMNFTAPEGTSSADIDRLQTKMKQYISNWGDNIDFYAVGANRLDETAKNQFTFIKDIIQKNKNVFTDNNIRGTYKFYIQNVSSGAKVSEFEITF